MTAGRRTAVGLAIALVFLLSSAIAAALAPSQSTSNVLAYDAGGRKLSVDPRIQPGSSIKVVVSGFVPGAAVRVHVEGPAIDTTVTADAHGVVTYIFSVPSTLTEGQNILSFVGPPGGGPLPSISVGPSSNRSDPQVIVARIPRVGLFPFRIDTSGSGTGGTSTAHPPPGPVTPSGSGQLGSTGSDIAGVIGLAVLALVIGAMALLLGRRRRLSRHRRHLTDDQRRTGISRSLSSAST